MARKPKNPIVPDSPGADDPILQPQKTKQEQQFEQLKELLPGFLPQDDQVIVDVEADKQTEDGPMSDEELLTVIEIKKERARSHIQDEISIRAAISNEYYLAQPTGLLKAPEGVGRSNYVDTSVADTINWLLPPLMDAFCSTNQICEFTARNPAQNKEAQMTTAMVNSVWERQAGWRVARTWIHAALMQPASFIKVYWEADTEVKTKRYVGLTDLQFGALAAAAESGEFKFVAHKMRENPAFNALTTIQHGLNIANAIATGQQPQLVAPQAKQAVQAVQQGQNPIQAAQSIQIDPTDLSASQMLHDVKIYFEPDPNSPQKGEVKIENIPLEQIYFDSQAVSLEHTDYVAHGREMTISDLRALRIGTEEQLDRISDLEFDPRMSMTYEQRHELDQTYAYRPEQEGVDESMRRLVVVESYLKVDYDKDGLAEWRKVVTCGKEILLNEACDGHPFISLCSNPLPYLAFGVSTAEQAQNIQLNNTHLVRALIDSVSLGANAQMYAVDGEVNIDDLTDPRPGGIVRVKNPESVGILASGSGDVASVTTLLELLETVKQERTGVQKLTQGSDADVNNETASGFYMMKEQAALRIDLMIREFAETGFKPLALRIQKLLAEYQNEYMQVMLNGQIMQADPMDACNQFDLKVSVGLGTNDKSRELAYLQQIMQMQQLAMQESTGMVNLFQMYNTSVKLLRAMGYTNPDEFISKPQSPMPQPPAPQMPPEKQAEIQIEQMKAQTEAQQAQHNEQMDVMKFQAQQANDTKMADQEHQRELQKLQHKFDMEKLYLQAAIQREQIAAQAMLNPKDEQAMFNETFASTTDSMNAALAKIDMHATGQYDSLINTIANAPEPQMPQAPAVQGMQPQQGQ
jgi:hypothetical protein